MAVKGPIPTPALRAISSNEADIPSVAKVSRATAISVS